MQVTVRDGVIHRASPDGIVGYIDIPIRNWAKNWPLA